VVAGDGEAAATPSTRMGASAAAAVAAGLPRLPAAGVCSWLRSGRTGWGSEAAVAGGSFDGDGSAVVAGAGASVEARAAGSIGVGVPDRMFRAAARATAFIATGVGAGVLADGDVSVAATR
jgi:hypothetical protein